MTALATTAAILLAMGGVVVAFRLFVRRPVGVTSSDPAGLRTVVVFEGDDADLFADDVPDGPYVGLRLFTRLCDGLSPTGIGVENRGKIHYAQRVDCVVGNERFQLVLERAERIWIASVEWAPQNSAERRHLALTGQVFAPPDSPQLRQLLTSLDRWLHAQPDLRSVRWHRKENWLAEDVSTPASGPMQPRDER